MKKYLKGLLAVAVVFCCVFAFSACGTGSDHSWSSIKGNGQLIIGLDDTFAPMGFRDNAGKLVGFDIDMATAVCKELGVTPQFKPIDWEAKELELESKNIDCIWNGMSATKERQEKMSLSKKYLNNKIILMTMKEDLKIASSKDLKELKIGTQKDSSALEMMTANEDYDSFKDNITEYDTYDEAILDLKAGRLDCISIDEVLGNYKNTKMNESLYTCEFNFGNDFYAIGFRKSDVELTNKVNDALQKLIDNGTAAEISKKWFGKDIVILEDY